MSILLIPVNGIANAVLRFVKGINASSLRFFLTQQITLLMKEIVPIRIQYKPRKNIQ